MIRQKPEVDPHRRYNIKEVCDLLCIHRDTLTKYTNLDVIVPIRISSREIYYLGSEIILLYEHLTSKSRSR